MAASAGGIRAGQAFVELTADDSKLRAGLAAAQSRLAAWGGQVRKVGLAVFAAGAGIVAPLIAAAKQWASGGDALLKLSTRTGMTVELLSELRYAAGLSGTAIEDLEKASKKLSVTITDAMNGSQSALDKLGGVKITKQLAALTPDQQFLTVAKAVGMIADPTRRAAAAVAVFGRSGTQLLPLIEHMEELRTEARKVGANTTKEQAQRAAELEEAWKRLEGATARISKALGSTLAPALTRVITDILPMLYAAKQWIAHNQTTVVSIAKLGVGLIAAGGVILGVSAVITTAAWVFRALGMAVSVVTGTISVLRSIAAGVSAAIGFLTTNLWGTSVAMRAVAAAGSLTSTALATARSGVLLLALAFGRIRFGALSALSGVPALLGRIAAGAIAAAGSLRGVTIRGDFGPQRVSYADRGRAVVSTGAQAASGMATAIGAGLRGAGTALAALPARVGAAFAGMGRMGVSAIGGIRTALAGAQVAIAMFGSLIVSGIGRGLAAIPALAGRAFGAIPALLASAWSGIAGVVASGAGLVGRALTALPGLGMAAGRALVAGIGSAVAVLPGLFYGAIGMVATAVQAIPGLVMGGFGLLRTAVMALPGLFSAAFSVLPALIGLAMNPVVLLGGAIVGLGVYLYQTTDGGRMAMSQLGQAFAEVKDDAVTAFGGISEALSAGDIMGAVKILWAFIRLEWTRGISAVENLVQAFAGGVAKIFLNVGFGINTAFWTAVYGIQDAIDWVVGGIIKVFSTVIGTIASKVAYLLELVGAIDEGTSEKIANLSQSVNAGVDQVRAQRMGERDQKLANFKGLWDEKVQGVNDWMAQGMQGRDAEIAAKRAELDQAIADAKRARNAPPPSGGPDDEGGGTPPPPPGPDTTDLSQQLADLMNRVQLKVDTTGTFNATALDEMGVGGTAAERGLQAAEKTARNTQDIRDSLAGNALTYD